MGSHGESEAQKDARHRQEKLYDLQESYYKKQAQLQAVLQEKQDAFFAAQQKIAKRQEETMMRSLGYLWDGGKEKWIKGPQTEAQKRSDQIRQLLQERQLAALEGNAPVDPALERDIAKAAAAASREAAAAGGEESTAGRQIMAKFNEWANIVRSGARSGELGLGGQLLGQREGQRLQQQDLMSRGISTIPGLYGGASQALAQMGGLLGNPGITLSHMGTTSSGLLNSANQQGGQSFWGPALGLVGGAIGGYFGGPGGAYFGSQAGGMAGNYIGGDQYQQGGYSYYPSWEEQQSGYYYPS